MTRVVPRRAVPVLPDEAARTLRAGMRLGRYVLLCPIASGGMAHVWAAEQLGDLGFRKLVALKTILPELAQDSELRAMFLDEARLASRIRHANVVEVLDLGVEGSIVFQAMTLIDGIALSGWTSRLEGARLPFGVTARIVVDVLRGLHAAHELRDDDGHLLGLVHRDVSPQNVLVGADGVAKLADFGIAKAFGRAALETATGQVKGKIRYLAPELLDGLPASPQSDLFSVGVVLWELLAGQRLFDLPTEDVPRSARKRRIVRPVSEVASDVPPAIADVAMRALCTDPFARFASALEMADALDRAARAEGLETNHGDVAASLERSLGRELSRRRDAIRAARRPSANVGDAPPPELATDTVTISEPAARRTRFGARGWLVLGGAALAAGMIVVATRPRAPIAPAPAEAASSAPIASSAEPIVEAPPSTSASASAPPPRVKPGHKVRGPRPAAPPAQSVPKPMFESPY